MIRIFSLYQPTNWTNRTLQGQPQVFRISEHAFNPIINVEMVVAFMAKGFSRLSLNSWRATERAQNMIHDWSIVHGYLLTFPSSISSRAILRVSSTMRHMLSLHNNDSCSGCSGCCIGLSLLILTVFLNSLS
jgi:hypothetical protein